VMLREARKRRRAGERSSSDRATPRICRSAFIAGNGPARPGGSATEESADGANVQPHRGRCARLRQHSDSRECVMKVWSDFSVIVRLAAICVLVGFIAGLCASGRRSMPAEWPNGTPSAAVTSSASSNRH
jgi:hypothetical protein